MTIFALSSGPGRAGVAVIRVSGPAAGSALEALVGRRPAARRATYAPIRDAQSGTLLDRGMVLWLPGPGSATGEDMAEFHLHGGRAVVASVLDALDRVDGLRPAEPGDFTRRAFHNGRLDLTQVEGLADLIAAETEAQRRQAVRQMDGDLAALYEAWRARLVRALAHAEAAIDFADEELPEDLPRRFASEISDLRAEIQGHLDDDHAGERLRDGIQVAILGPPNVGKSSLLNALAKRDAAIVAPSPGTTRDVIEVHLDLGGYPVTLADTAGLRPSEDQVEAEGVARAQARAQAADLKLAVYDATRWPAPEACLLGMIDDRTLTVVNKCDLRAVAPAEADVLAISALTGEGLDELLARLAQAVGERFDASAAPALTRVRHRRALEDCIAQLARAAAAGSVELAAEDARLAGRALGRITGQVDVEDLLDVIFADFCIGK